jgi:multiple sugar transport system substrate-binding protein
MSRAFRLISLAVIFSLVLVTLNISVKAQDKITLTYWTHNHAPSIPINQQIIDEFVKENPNVEIIFDNAPHANYEQKILTAFGGNQGPDVFWAGDWMVPQFLAGKMIAPVDPTAFGVKTQDEFEKLFAPGSLDAFKADGKIYTGGTSEYNTFSLIYDVDDFKAAGIALPSKDKPLTWEEFADIAAKLTKQEGGKTTRVGIEWPFTVPIWTVLILEPMLRQIGGEIVDPQSGKPLFNAPEMLKVMSYVKSLKDKKAIDDAVYTDLLQDFANDRASMIFGGPWAVAPLKDMNAKLNYDIAPLPQFKDAKSRVTTLYAWAWFVNANSSPEKQAMAWKFVNKLTSKGQLWWDKVGYVQARIGKADNGKDLVAYRAESDPRLAVIFNDYQYGKSEFRSTSYFEISDIMTRALTKVLAGGDPAKVLADAQTAAEFTLK